MPSSDAAPFSFEQGYHRDELEFARLVNLCDAVFAIALTLLVLGITVSDVPSELLGAAMQDVVPELAAFVLSFLLVASIWWQHHRFFARLERIDPPLLGWTIVGLGFVALVPFPTGLLGSHPTSRVAVITFTGIFILLVAVFAFSTRHAQRKGLWRADLPEATYRWVIACFLVTAATMLLAAAVAWSSPLGGLAVLAASSLPERLLSRRAPRDYRAWA